MVESLSLVLIVMLPVIMGAILWSLNSFGAMKDPDSGKLAALDLRVVICVMVTQKLIVTGELGSERWFTHLVPCSHDHSLAYQNGAAGGGRGALGYPALLTSHEVKPLDAPGAMRDQLIACHDWDGSAGEFQVEWFGLWYLPFLRAIVFVDG